MILPSSESKLLSNVFWCTSLFPLKCKHNCFCFQFAMIYLYFSEFELCVSFTEHPLQIVFLACSKTISSGYKTIDKSLTNKDRSVLAGSRQSLHPIYINKHGYRFQLIRTHDSELWYTVFNWIIHFNIYVIDRLHNIIYWVRKLVQYLLLIDGWIQFSSTFFSIIICFYSGSY